MKKDVIIVGQGLAGSVLALSYLAAGYTVQVIAHPTLSPCSKVAAGIWNPVVFKRLTKSWMADALLPELQRFYKGAEQLLQTSFLTDRQILKFFTEEQEIQLWQKKSHTELQDFIDPHIYPPQQGFPEASFSKVLPCGNIDLPLFLESLRRYLLDTRSLLEESFDYATLQTGPLLRYKGIEAEQLVFCEGHLVNQNPFFRFIPLKPAKGEVVTIRCEGLSLEKDILNKGVFVLPLGDHIYKVGATYEWNELNDLTTDKAKLELCTKLEQILNVPYTLLKQEAGIRPSALDRRPVIGRHPEHHNLCVFNGLGTKGVMLAPFFAKQFIAWQQGTSPLDPEVDVARFYKYALK